MEDNRKSFFFFIDAVTTMGVTVKAESEEEGNAKVEAMLADKNFMDKYRENCEFFDVEIADTVIESEDEDDAE